MAATTEQGQHALREKMSLKYTRLFAMRFWSLSCTDQNAWQRFFVVRFFLDTQQMNFFLVHLGG
jgi:hypothetical protein